MNHLSAKAMYSHQMFEFNITPAAIVGPMIMLGNRNKICLFHTTPKTNCIGIQCILLWANFLDTGATLKQY